jgi:hypothetical protein
MAQASTYIQIAYGQPTPGTATSIASIRERRFARHSSKSMLSELITNSVRRSWPPSAQAITGRGNFIRSLTLPPSCRRAVR